jgi:Xaa-Pro aminopeptidase
LRELTQIPDRLERIRGLMRAKGLDGLIVNFWANVVYVTAFDGISDMENPHVALITKDRAFAFIDSRYFETATAQAGKRWETVLARHEVQDKAAETIRTLKLKRVGVEDTVGYRTFLAWRRLLKGHQIVATHHLVEAVREVKDLDEIARIATAQSISEEVLAHLLSFIKPGMTEREVAFEIEFKLRQYGAETLAFAPIVAAGANGSLPHAMPSDYRIKKHDFVTLDFGAQYRGYKSDMTRTICVGTATRRQKVIYDLVLKAQCAAVDAASGDKKSAEIDHGARSIIDGAGYSESFGHGTGHGVGLAIHELPSLSPNSKGTVPIGAVVTIEPGIYLPGRLGVRIEDMVVTLKDGSYLLTNAPKELIELEV